MAQPNQKEIDAKDAVKRAVAYVSDIYRDNASIADVMLEEIELNDTETAWHVTVSFRLTNIPDTPGGTLGLTAAILGQYGAKARAYKVIAVDAKTGHIRSMKIREMPRGNA